MHTTLDKNAQISTSSQVHISARFGDDFGSADERARTRYREFSALYDAQTVRHLTQRGIDKGWTCLEVGGGGGSIASWLCARVGDQGGVLATDIDTRFLSALRFRNLGVRCHDIRTEGLPEHRFDLAHARLVLMHLSDREQALRRMVKAIKPGGWIVLEEFDDVSYLPNPTINPGEVSLKIRHAFQQVLTSKGVDLRYGRLLPQKLQEIGLVNIGAEASVSLWKSRSAGTRLLQVSCEDLREPIIRSGLISEEEFESDMKLVDERDFMMPSPMMWTVWGQAPEEKSISAPRLPIELPHAEAMLPTVLQAGDERCEDLAPIGK